MMGLSLCIQYYSILHGIEWMDSVAWFAVDASQTTYKASWLHFKPFVLVLCFYFESFRPASEIANCPRITDTTFRNSWCRFWSHYHDDSTDITQSWSNGPKINIQFVKWYHRPAKGRTELEGSCVNSTGDFLFINYSGKPSGQIYYIKVCNYYLLPCQDPRLQLPLFYR